MHEHKLSIPLLHKPFVPYVVPFLLFGFCTYATLLLPVSPGIAYALKTLLVALSLLYFRRDYEGEIRLSSPWLALASGAAVFILWVITADLYPHIGASRFDPYAYGTGIALYGIISFRMIGAVLVVPVMEELFWRSFALRFLVDTNFRSVPPGTFTWYSFIVISVAFGFEHHYWLAGILAGMIYAAVLYRSKNLFVPILSHAVTNFLLGAYVIVTHRWYFW